MRYSPGLNAWRIVVAIVAMGMGTVAQAEPKLDYGRDIRPILADKCFKCHGFDDKKREAGLRLDQREGALSKLESGAVAIIPGQGGESALFKRITTADADEKMPPASTGKKLTELEIARLKTWIDQGAEYKDHWSFVPPQRPVVPTVKNMGAVRNPIDAFVVARLEQAGLAPSSPADKETLIRRVTFDLTGLPPTPKEIDDFLADAAPDAYERVVDRLLKSPRLGEHLGRYWLDAARYGDTHGLHLDNERSLWPYRDYVIGAFNNNLPFDQFIVEQMAGDLLPNPTFEQRVATGFNRCNVTTSEGGSIDDEVYVRYAVDRVETMSAVFLGLTTGCAVCHDHKYDPITQKEFYQLYAFFSASADKAMDGNALLPPPFLRVPTAETTAKLAQLDVELAQAKTAVTEALAKIEYTDPQPDRTAAALSNEPREVVWIEDGTPPGAKEEGGWQYATSKDGQVFSGEKASYRKGDGITQHYFTGANPPLNVGEGDKFFAYCYLDPANPPKTVMLQWNDGQWEHRAFWGDDTISFGAGDVPGHRKLGPLPELGKWVRLEVDAQHVGLPAGAVLNGWAFTQFNGAMWWDKAGILTRTPQAGQSFESQTQWELFETSLKTSATPPPVREAIKIEPEKRNDAQKKLVRDHFIEHVYPKTKEVLGPLKKRVEDLAKQRTDTENSQPSTLVMEDMPKPRDTFILVRGQYDKKGDKVEAGIPGVLGKLPEGAPANRLGLAKWLTHPQHPLTARVNLNRFWQQFFGTGLVKTSEDFGVQGQWPSHPELLDWLAREWIDGGWDTKRLLKLIVMSGTYQQASGVTPELLQKDPANELLSRGPRFRLDAEMVRDAALYTSGLVVEQIGGKSVKPYQPEGIWEAVAFQGSTTQNFKADSGSALYRRSLYTFWKRTAPPPNMMAFDAPSRESCTVRRARTNTPLQALVLMNDRQYVEAARALALRVIREGGATPAERLSLAFRLTTGRKPRPDEAAVLEKTFGRHLATFQANVDGAKKLLAVGEPTAAATIDPAELAAYTLACNLVLNLDEAVTKE